MVGKQITTVMKKSLLNNIDPGRVTLQGYERFLIKTDNKAVKGDPKLFCRYNGNLLVRFRCACSYFQRYPAKYATAIGSFCGYAMSLENFARLIQLFPVWNGRLSN